MNLIALMTIYSPNSIIIRILSNNKNNTNNEYNDNDEN